MNNKMMKKAINLIHLLMKIQKVVIINYMKRLKNSILIHSFLNK